MVLYWLYNERRQAGIERSAASGIQAGTFALRTPHRPNPIGMAVVTIEKIAGNSVFVRGMDCLNGTRLLDIKPALSGE